MIDRSAKSIDLSTSGQNPLSHDLGHTPSKSKAAFHEFSFFSSSAGTNFLPITEDIVSITFIDNSLLDVMNANFHFVV